MTIERIAERAAEKLAPHVKSPMSLEHQKVKWIAQIIAKELDPLAKCVEACDQLRKAFQESSSESQFAEEVSTAEKAILEALSALKKDEPEIKRPKFGKTTSPSSPPIVWHGKTPKRKPSAP